MDARNPVKDESTKQITTVKHQLPPEVVRFLGVLATT